MNGEDYEAGRPVPTKTPDYGPDPWRRGHDPLCLCEQCVAHDSLCPVNTATAADMEAAGVRWVCACGLIRTVREDERALHADDLREYGARGERNGYAAALRDAKAAVEALHEEYVGEEYAQGELALRVAVAAITALGGER